MKTRSGFVSNSSSSSFILGVRTTLKEALDELYTIEHQNNGIFRELIGDVVSVIKHTAKKFNLKHAAEDAGYENVQEYFREDRDGKKIFKLLNSGFVLYTGYWSDEDSAVERLLCEMDLNYESDNLIIIHDGGY